MGERKTVNPTLQQPPPLPLSAPDRTSQLFVQHLIHAQWWPIPKKDCVWSDRRDRGGEGSGGVS